MTTLVEVLSKSSQENLSACREKREEAVLLLVELNASLHAFATVALRPSRVCISRVCDARSCGIRGQDACSRLTPRNRTLYSPFFAFLLSRRSSKRAWKGT